MMIKNMKVLIVLVNYNGLHLLKKHLQSVLSTKYPNFDVLVVDNGSTDGSVEFLKNEYPNVLLVESEENLGFGRANNLGVFQYPEYDAYVFLNNDMSVESNWLNELVKVVNREEGVGAVGSKILYSKKRDGKYIVNSAGMELDNHYMAYDRHDGKIDTKELNVVEKVEALTGGALLVTKEAWDVIGGFNSNMFMYYEDIDLSLRLKDFGYDLYYCGFSTVYHDHMGSSKKMGSTKRNLMNMRNRYISIVSRMGYLIGLTETVWYLFNYFLWKIFFLKKVTLREYLERKQ